MNNTHTTASTTPQQHPNFEKGQGLIPAVVQHSSSGEVLMVGFMNEAAYHQTLSSGLVTFYSRSRQVIWVKGETSGHFLRVQAVALDCDHDTVLVRALPDGPTCHTGAATCFSELPTLFGSVLAQVGATIAARRTAPPPGSYTAALFQEGVDRIVQKIGEEAVEVVIEGKNADNERLLDESSDLLFHLMVLLELRGLSLADVEERLRGRIR